MPTLLILLPYLISLVIGCQLLWLIWPDGKKFSRALFFFLGAGLGLGISQSLVFLNLLFFHHYAALPLLVEHAMLFLVLAALDWRRSKTISSMTLSRPTLDVSTLLAFTGLFLLMTPLWFNANYWPDGGWDAWSTWNLKARFIFLAGDHWKDIFDPVLWRTSPHYPLYLPCLNVWGWTFLKEPQSIGPMLTALLFCFLTAGLIFSGLRYRMRNNWLFLVPLIIFAHSFCGELGISQYSDIIVGYYLLAAIIMLNEFYIELRIGFLCVTGLLLGFMSFAKPEGTLATMIIAASMPFFLWLKCRAESWANLIKRLAAFAGCLALAAIPLILFQILCSPKNQTFINGLTSTTNPATPERLAFMFVFLGVELISPKWSGLWILLAVVAVLLGKKLFQQGLWYVPVFLTMYMAVIFAYYFVNTRWEIGWWMGVSLHRILFTLLPTILWWMFKPLKH